MRYLAGLLGLLWIATWLGAIALTIYGAVLAFSASVWIGLVALLVEPAPLIIGLVKFFGNIDLAEKLAHALGLS